MAEFRIETEPSGAGDAERVLRVQADWWHLESYDWFEFYRTNPELGEDDVLVLTVKSSIVRNIRRFEEPTEA